MQIGENSDFFLFIGNMIVSCLERDQFKFPCAGFFFYLSFYEHGIVIFLKVCWMEELGGEGRGGVNIPIFENIFKMRDYPVTFSTCLINFY